jgi:FkbM family methyltransferase
VAEFQLGTMLGALAQLYNKGLRFNTIVDLGCADGTFCLSVSDIGLVPGATCVNVDANGVYEPSLKEIQRVVGGHYAIAAVSDSDGEAEMQSAGHIYWGHLVPSADSKSQQAVKVPTMTLDTLMQRLEFKPPILLKLDVEGSELAALRGARNILRETDVIICETVINAFGPIGEFLSSCNFGLFDLTEIARASDGSVYQLYPVFLNRRCDHIRQKLLCDPTHNDALVAQMDKRRQTLLELNAQLLAKHRRQKVA